MDIRKYFLNLLIGIDQLGNCILGGEADETISARCWRNRNKKYFHFLRILVDKLFWFDDNHCEESYYTEELRKQLPSEYRSRKQ